MAVDPAYESIVREDSQTWNRYAYARNNPVVRNDPTGKVDNATIKADARAEGIHWTPAVSPEQRAFEHGMAYALSGLVAAPLVAVALPKFAGDMGVGALIAAATSAPQILSSDAPVDQKLDALATATTAGAITAPISPARPLVGVPAGSASSFVTSYVLEPAITPDTTKGTALAGITGGVAGVLTQFLPKPVQPYAAAALQWVMTAIGDHTPTPTPPPQRD